jgi:hypothetical protein
MMRRARAAATTALLFCGAVACAGTRASSNAAPPAAPPAASTDASGPVAAADTGESRPAPIPVQARPLVVVMPSGDAYLVLGAGPEQRMRGDAWQVVYVAGDDPAELARPETRARLASIAADFVGAFQPIAEAKVQRLSVAALFGTPGGSGVIEQRWFARGAGPWRADGAPRQFAVEQVPAIDGKLVRERREEAAARDAAVEFMSDAGRADYDAAWARTSAFTKTTMSRAEFDRHLASMRPVDAPRDAKLYLSFPATERFLPGSFMEAWLARETADGSGFQALTLRLDDDMEWRVAGVVDFSVAPPTPVLASPREDP